MPKQTNSTAPVRHFRVLHGGVGKHAHGDTFADYQMWDPKLDPEWGVQAKRLLDLGAVEELDSAPDDAAPDVAG